MKKTSLTIALGLLIGLTTINGQSFKEKMQAKMDKANAKLQAKQAASKQKNRKFKNYDFEDVTGISGTYFVNEPYIDNECTMGFDFKKEEGGEIVNKLKVWMGGKSYGGRPNSMDYVLSEKIQRKFSFNFFDLTDKDVITLANNQDAFFFMEVSKGIYSFTQNGKVLSVLSKDSSQFADFDTETVQVLFDQKRAQMNKEKMDKETAVWKKNAVYAKNINKIVFATEDHHLMKRGYMNKPPMVNGKDFKTVLDMAGNMQYMAFFQYPPSTSHPGQDINIVYEMNGIKVGRVDYRSKSAAWGKAIPKISSSDFAYRQHSPKPLRMYSTFRSRYVQDYAFIQLLYMNKNKFLIGNKYTLTVKMYANRDGENGELIAEGQVSLLYSSAAHKAFNGDSSKPDQKAIWAEFEEFLDE